MSPSFTLRSNLDFPLCFLLSFFKMTRPIPGISLVERLKNIFVEALAQLTAKLN